MSSSFLARAMMTALPAGQSLAPLLIDLIRTRGRRANWPRGARFRLVSQRLSPALAGAAEVVLIWWQGPYLVQRFYFVAVLAAIPIVGFVAAKFMHCQYDVASRDQNNIPYVRIRTSGKVFKLEINAVLVPIAAILLLGAVYLF
jgi:hypothetical protein